MSRFIRQYRRSNGNEFTGQILPDADDMLAHSSSDVPNSGNAKMDQYIAYLNTSEANISRRALTNRFYLTIITSLAAVGALIASNGIAPSFVEGWGRSLTFGGIGFATFVLGRMWSNQLAQYSRLSSAKYTVLHEMEKQLPFSPLKMEEDVFKEKNWPFSMVRKETAIAKSLCILGLFLIVLAIVFIPGIESYATKVISAFG